MSVTLELGTKQKTNSVKLMWQEAVVAYFKVSSKYFQRVGEENHDRPLII
jgi:hypothetical protein